MKKTYTIYNYPKPIYSVCGQPIKDLLEVDDTRTVKSKLDRWGIKYDTGYVCLEDIMSVIKGSNEGEPLCAYISNDPRFDEIVDGKI